MTLSLFSPNTDSLGKEQIGDSRNAKRKDRYPYQSQYISELFQLTKESLFFREKRYVLIKKAGVTQLETSDGKK